MFWDITPPSEDFAMPLKLLKIFLEIYDEAAANRIKNDRYLLLVVMEKLRTLWLSIKVEFSCYVKMKNIRGFLSHLLLFYYFRSLSQQRLLYQSTRHIFIANKEHRYVIS